MMVTRNLIRQFWLLIRLESSSRHSHGRNAMLQRGDIWRVVPADVASDLISDQLSFQVRYRLTDHCIREVVVPLDRL